MTQFKDDLLEGRVKGRFYFDSEGDEIYEVLDIICPDTRVSTRKYHSDGRHWVQFQDRDIPDCLYHSRAPEGIVKRILFERRVQRELAQAQTSPSCTLEINPETEGVRREPSPHIGPTSPGVIHFRKRGR